MALRAKNPRMRNAGAGDRIRKTKAKPRNMGSNCCYGKGTSINLNDQLASISCIVNHLFMSAFAHDANQSKSEMESYIKAT